MQRVCYCGWNQTGLTHAESVWITCGGVSFQTEAAFNFWQQWLAAFVSFQNDIVSKMIHLRYCFQNDTPQILFSKFSTKTHCCLHWLLRSGKLSHRSVSVCNFLFANKSRSNLATKTKTNILHQDRSIFYYISVNLGCHTTKLVTHVLHNVWHISIVLVVALSITLHHW